MREALILKRPRPRKDLARVDAIRRDFQVRAFGEELARVNLDLTPEERLNYIAWMVELARKHGVPRTRQGLDEA
jgi:hypothetical protein